jgi:hypothetical protein
MTPKRKRMQQRVTITLRRCEMDKSFAVFSVEDDEDSVLFDSEYAAQRWAEMLGIPTSKILFRNVLTMADLNGG